MVTESQYMRLDLDMDRGDNHCESLQMDFHNIQYNKYHNDRHTYYARIYKRQSLHHRAVGRVCYNYSVRTIDRDLHCPCQKYTHFDRLIRRMYVSPRCHRFRHDWREDRQSLEYRLWPFQVEHCPDDRVCENRVPARY